MWPGGEQGSGGRLLHYELKAATGQRCGLLQCGLRGQYHLIRICPTPFHYGVPVDFNEIAWSQWGRRLAITGLPPIKGSPNLTNRVVSQAFTSVKLSWAGLGWAGLGWAGLGWAGLGWAGLGWAGLGQWRCVADLRGAESPWPAGKVRRSRAAFLGFCDYLLHPSSGHDRRAPENAPRAPQPRKRERRQPASQPATPTATFDPPPPHKAIRNCLWIYLNEASRERLARALGRLPGATRVWRGDAVGRSDCRWRNRGWYCGWSADGNEACCPTVCLGHEGGLSAVLSVVDAGFAQPFAPPVTSRMLRASL